MTPCSALMLFVALAPTPVTSPTISFPGLCLVKKNLPVHVTGDPGGNTLAVIGVNLFNPPIGGLWIAPPQVLLSLGKMPPSGVIDFELRIPNDAAFVGLTFYAQALVDTQWSDLARKRVGPVTILDPTPKSNSKFGWSVEAADYNSDGFDDIFIGAPRAEVGGTLNRGLVFYGDGPDLASFQVLDPPGLTSGAWFGAAIASGDINSDGLKDVAVGAILATVGGLTEAGLAYIYLSPNLQQVQIVGDPTPEQGSHFGGPIVIGDLNHDGFDDVAIAAPLSTVNAQALAGEVYVFYGPTLVPNLHLTEPNPETNAIFGSCLSIGDVDGDGYLDLLVGASSGTAGGQPQAGEAFIFFGPSFARVLNFSDPDPHPVDRFGRASTIGDFNGDGYGDVAISSYRASTGTLSQAGEAWVFMGPNLYPFYHLIDPIPEEVGEYGVSMAKGNVDGNGKEELAVGVEFANLPGGYEDAGAVILYRNMDWDDPQRLVEYEPQDASVFGFSIVFANLYGSGLQSILSGAILSDYNGLFDVGRVTLYP
ncbi:MAG: hypothetical protein U1E76_28290 [Planctomycetota bacterium]